MAECMSILIWYTIATGWNPQKLYQLCFIKLPPLLVYTGNAIHMVFVTPPNFTASFTHHSTGCPLLDPQLITSLSQVYVDCVWNVMAHAQKPDFVLRRNRRVHLNQPGGVSSVDYWQPRCACISGSNAGYTMFRGSVKGTGYPLHSPVSPSLPLPCITALPSHFNWTLPL